MTKHRFEACGDVLIASFQKDPETGEDIRELFDAAQKETGFRYLLINFKGVKRVGQMALAQLGTTLNSPQNKERVKLTGLDSIIDIGTVTRLATMVMYHADKIDAIRNF